MSLPMGWGAQPGVAAADARADRNESLRKVRVGGHTLFTRVAKLAARPSGTMLLLLGATLCKTGEVVRSPGARLRMGKEPERGSLLLWCRKAKLPATPESQNWQYGKRTYKRQCTSLSLMPWFTTEPSLRRLSTAPLANMPSTALCSAPLELLQAAPVTYKLSRSRSATSRPWLPVKRMERLVLVSRYGHDSCATCM